MLKLDRGEDQIEDPTPVCPLPPRLAVGVKNGDAQFRQIPTPEVRECAFLEQIALICESASLAFIHAVFMHFSRTIAKWQLWIRKP